VGPDRPLRSGRTLITSAAVPEQAPDHPTKMRPVSGVAVSVTCDPTANQPVRVMVLPAQLMPPGLDVTVPVLVPVMWTVSGSVRTGVGQSSSGSKTRLPVALTQFGDQSHAAGLGAGVTACLS